MLDFKLLKNKFLLTFSQNLILNIPVSIAILFLLFATPIFYPLKNLFVIIVEIFFVKRELNNIFWINFMNSKLLLLSSMFFLCALYIWLTEHNNTRYFFVVFIGFVFTASNIYIMKNGFPGGYSNLWDFNDFLLAIPGYAKADYFGTNYPPLAVGLFKMMYKLFPKNPSDSTEYVLKYLLTLYLLFTSLTLFILFEKSLKDKYNYLISGSLFLTGPILFAYQRMNLMHLALIFTMIFVLYYNSPSIIKRIIALFSLAIAANIKYFPAIFGLLLLKEKKWKSALICFSFGILLFIFPVFLQEKNKIETTVVTNTNVENSVNNNDTVDEKPINTSVPEATNKILKLITSTKSFASNPHVMASVSTQALVGRLTVKFGFTSQKDISFAMTISLILFLIISIFSFFITKNKVNELAILSFLAILTPISSAWYGIIFLFIPFLYLLKNEKFTKIQHIEFILYILIFIFVLDYKYILFMPSEEGHWRVFLLYLIVIFEVIYETFITKFSWRKK